MPRKGGGAGVADENDVENDKNHKDYSPRERPRGRKERHRVRSMRGEAAPRAIAATANLNTANPNNANNANNAGRHNRPPDPFSLPFRLREARGGGVHMHTAVFTVPLGWEPALMRHPVIARGGQFEFEEGRYGPGTITCTFHSAKPASTAEAIRQRLLVRLNDPSPPGAEDCSVM